MPIDSWLRAIVNWVPRHQVSQPSGSTQIVDLLKQVERRFDEAEHRLDRLSRDIFVEPNIRHQQAQADCMPLVVHSAPVTPRGPSSSAYEAVRHPKRGGRGTPAVPQAYDISDSWDNTVESRILPSNSDPNFSAPLRAEGKSASQGSEAKSKNDTSSPQVLEIITPRTASDLSLNHGYIPAEQNTPERIAHMCENYCLLIETTEKNIRQPGSLGTAEHTHATENFGDSARRPHQRRGL